MGPEMLPVAKLLSVKGERERERKRWREGFLFQIVCIYMKAKLDLFIKSIKILSL